MNIINRALTLGLRIKEMVVLSLFALFGTFSEIIGLGVFYPIFEYMNMGGDINALTSDSQLWVRIVQLFNALGIKVSLFLLFSTSVSFIVLKALINYMKVIYIAKVSQNLIKKLRDKYFKYYMNATTSYHDRVSIGDLVNAMTTELNSALYMISAPINIIIFSIMGVSYLSVLTYLSWKMTIVAIVITLSVVVVSSVWLKKSKTIGRMLALANSSMSSFLVDRLRSPRLVRLSGTEKAEKIEFNGLTKKQKKYGIHNSILSAKTDSSMEPLIIIASMLFIYVAYTRFNVDIEIVGVFLLIVMRLTPVAKGLLTTVQKVKSKIGSYDLVQSRLKSMKDNSEKNEGQVCSDKILGEIIISGVEYKYYGAEKSAIYDINLRIKNGSMVAIVGPSGSGKSTLIDLLPRLRDPIFGSIKIGSYMINEYDIETLRKSIAYLPQSPQIFYGTIKNHIKYGKIDATDEEIHEAAKLADAHDFIQNMPEKYESLVGSDAVRLSGGQKQRLDLARVLIMKSSILILDEPTSSLDTESETKFMKSLHGINRKTGVTVIIITHNIKSIIGVDNIIVLNEGTIAAEGMHSELVKNNEWYKKVCNMYT